MLASCPPLYTVGDDFNYFRYKCALLARMSPFTLKIHSQSPAAGLAGCQTITLLGTPYINLVDGLPASSYGGRTREY